MSCSILCCPFFFVLFDRIESNEFSHFGQLLAQARHAFVQRIHFLLGLVEMLLHAQELGCNLKAVLNNTGVALALFDRSLEVDEFLDAGY